MSRERQVEFARTILLRLLEARPRSQQELQQALARRNVPKDVADELLERFTEVGLVDDQAFAQALASTRMGVGLQGGRRIQQELRRRGVSDEVSRQVLDDVAPEEEEAAALRFAQRRIRTLQSLEPPVARRRLLAALARRGFPMSVSLRATESVLGAADELPDEGAWGQD